MSLNIHKHNSLCHTLSVAINVGSEFLAIKNFFATRLHNLALFAISCVMAGFYNWQAEDLVWSLWLSNLFITGAIITCTTVVVSQKEAAYSLIGAGLFMFAIFFHLGQTAPLFATLPFEGKRMPLHLLPETWAKIFTHYWMWLPVAFYHSREAMIHPPNPFSKDPKAKNPFKSILFFNALVYVVIGFNKIWGLNGISAAVFMYFFYFFLFDRDVTKRR